MSHPHTVASPTPLPNSTPPTRHAEDLVDSDSESEDAEDEGPTAEAAEAAEDEDPAARDEGLAARDKGSGMRVESLGLGGDATVPEGQQRAASAVETAVGEHLGLGYRALRRWEIALGEGRMPSVFEVDPEDDRVYIDAPTYPLPAPPVQTPPSPEWSSGLLPISPTPSIVSSPISSPMIPLTVSSPVASPATAEIEGFLTELGAQVEMQEGLIHDHTVRLGELSPVLFKRSLEHEQERVAMTFGVIWRPVLALESWASQTDAHKVALWHVISDTQMENQEL
ncbi:hypothetical protein Tco_1366237 [Tanacetum coccineum]